MLVAIYLFMILLCFLVKRSRFVFVAMLVFMWTLIGWSTDNVDTWQYLHRYYNYGSIGTLEILFASIVRLGNRLGLSYQEFLIISSGIALFMVGSTIYKLTPNYNFVLAVYSVYPFIMDTVQIRQFFAVSFVIFGLRYFVAGGKRNMLRFALCILAASFIHVSCYVYFLLFLAKKFDLKATILMSVSFVGLLYFSFGTNLVQAVAVFLNMERKIMETVMSASMAYSGNNLIVYSMEVVIYFCFAVFILLMIRKRQLRSLFFDELSEEKENELKKSAQLTELALKVNILFMTILPLLLYSADLYRIQHGLFVFNYIVFSGGLEGAEEGVKRSIKNVSFRVFNSKITFMSLMFAFTFLFLFALFVNFDGVTYPFFYSNLLWSRL